MDGVQLESNRRSGQEPCHSGHKEPDPERPHRAGVHPGARINGPIRTRSRTRRGRTRRGPSTRNVRCTRRGVRLRRGAIRRGRRRRPHRRTTSPRIARAPRRSAPTLLPDVHGEQAEDHQDHRAHEHVPRLQAHARAGEHRRQQRAREEARSRALPRTRGGRGGRGRRGRILHRRARPDLRGRRFTEGGTVGGEGTRVPAGELRLLGCAAAGGVVVQRPAEDPAAHLLPVRARVGQVQVPRLVDRARRRDGVPRRHRQVHEAQVFPRHAERVLAGPPVLLRQPRGKGENDTGLVRRKRLDASPEFGVCLVVAALGCAHAHSSAGQPRTAVRRWRARRTTDASRPGFEPIVTAR
ncbi:hypothetical protein SAMN05216486_10438 [bacterium JGI 053]|nr:hypothetical protein SAMN05216486_10438 [bacterium JGI 053]